MYTGYDHPEATARQKTAARWSHLRLVALAALVVLAAGIVAVVDHAVHDWAVTAVLDAAGLAIGLYIAREARPDMRPFARGAVIAAASWVAATYAIGLSRWTLLAWVAGSTVAGARWALDRRIRDQLRIRHEMEVDLSKWPHAAQRAGLGRSHLGQIDTTYGVPPGGARSEVLRWQATLYLDCKLADARSRVADLETFMGWPAGSCTIEKHPTSRLANHALITVVFHDQADDETSYGLPKRGPLPKQIPLGPYADKQPCHLPVHDGKGQLWHLLIGGITGGGKSGLLALICAYVAAATDAVLWFVDGKGYQEAIFWEPVADSVADQYGATSLGRALLAALEAREAYAAQRRWRSWRASPATPWLVVVVDEAAELDWTAVDWKSIARRCRSVGIWLIFATQRATGEAIPTQVRTNLSTRISFRTGDADAQFVLYDEKADTRSIPSDKPGTCFMQRDANDRVMQLRIKPYMDDTTIERLVEQFRDQRPALDEPTRAAASRYGYPFRITIPTSPDQEAPVPTQPDPTPAPAAAASAKFAPLSEKVEIPPPPIDPAQLPDTAPGTYTKQELTPELVEKGREFLTQAVIAATEAKGGAQLADLTAGPLTRGNVYRVLNKLIDDEVVVRAERGVYRPGPAAPQPARV